MTSLQLGIAIAVACYDGPARPLREIELTDPRIHERGGVGVWARVAPADIPRSLDLQQGSLPRSTKIPPRSGGVPPPPSAEPMFSRQRALKVAGWRTPQYMPGPAHDWSRRQDRRNGPRCRSWPLTTSPCGISSLHRSTGTTANSRAGGRADTHREASHGSQRRGSGGTDFQDQPRPDFSRLPVHRPGGAWLGANRVLPPPRQADAEPRDGRQAGSRGAGGQGDRRCLREGRRRPEVGWL